MLELHQHRNLDQFQLVVQYQVVQQLQQIIGHYHFGKRLQFHLLDERYSYRLLLKRDQLDYRQYHEFHCLK